MTTLRKPFKIKNRDEMLKAIQLLSKLAVNNNPWLRSERQMVFSALRAKFGIDPVDPQKMIPGMAYMSIEGNGSIYEYQSLRCLGYFLEGSIYVFGRLPRQRDKLKGHVDVYGTKFKVLCDASFANQSAVWTKLEEQRASGYTVSDRPRGLYGLLPVETIITELEEYFESLI